MTEVCNPISRGASVAVQYTPSVLDRIAPIPDQGKSNVSMNEKVTPMGPNLQKFYPYCIIALKVFAALQCLTFVLLLVKFHGIASYSDGAVPALISPHHRHFRRAAPHLEYVNFDSAKYHHSLHPPTFVHSPWETHRRRIYKYRCPRLLAGNQAEATRISRLLKRKPYKPAAPSAVHHWVRNCTLYKRYYTKWLSTATLHHSESMFPVVFSVPFSSVEQGELLLRTIYRPQNTYCVHLSPQASTTEAEGALRRIAGCFTNVFIVDPHSHTGNRLKSDIKCAKEALRRDTHWKYFISLDDGAFPTQPNYEIINQLKSFNESIYIPSLQLSDTDTTQLTKAPVSKQHHHKSPKMDAPENDKTMAIIPKHLTEKGAKYEVRNETHAEGPQGTRSKTNGKHQQQIIDKSCYMSSAFIKKVFGGRHTQKLIADLSSSPTLSLDVFWSSLARSQFLPSGLLAAPNHSSSNYHKESKGISTLYPHCYQKDGSGDCILTVSELYKVRLINGLFAGKFDLSGDPIILDCLREHLRKKKAVNHNSATKKTG